MVNYRNLGISPVIAVILMLAITVSLSIGMFYNLESYMDFQTSSIDNNNIIALGQTEIIHSTDDELVIRNGFDTLEVKDVLINGVNCNLNSTNYTSSLIEINISVCVEALNQTIKDIRIISTQMILHEKLERVVETSSPSESLSPSLSEAVYTDYFVSTWDSSAISAGSSAGNQITLPLESGGTYNFTVDWRDGTNDTITVWNQAEVTHTYASGGIYKLNISGTLRGFRFAGNGDRLKIQNIESWGILNVGNSGGYFSRCNNLDSNATDTLNLTGTTTLSEMFFQANSFTGNLSSWDVSDVTNMNHLFYQASSFNSDLSNWDVSNVGSMERMFYDANNFTSDLSNWNISSVVSMFNMFRDASSFDSDLSGWDVSNVENMGAMFYGTSSFDSDLSSWDVSSVTNMYAMFRDASSFDSDLSSWDVNNVTEMSYMFFGASNFTSDIGSWNVSRVANMNWMFYGTDSFNQDLTGWCVPSIGSEPAGFVGGTSILTNPNKPIWGTCP